MMAGVILIVLGVAKLGGAIKGSSGAQVVAPDCARRYRGHHPERRSA